MCMRMLGWQASHEGPPLIEDKGDFKFVEPSILYNRFERYPTVQSKLRHFTGNMLLTLLSVLWEMETNDESYVGHLA